jgi:hypothetical protein
LIGGARRQSIAADPQAARVLKSLSFAVFVSRLLGTHARCQDFFQPMESGFNPFWENETA